MIFSIVTLCSCSQQGIIFKDNFRNNRHQWPLYADKEFTVAIKDKSLQFEKKSKNRDYNYCLWYSKQIPAFNTAKDFTIAFDAKIKGADDVTNGFDFQWGMIPKGDSEKPTLYQIDFSLQSLRLSKFTGTGGWEYFDSKYYSTADSLFELRYGEVNEFVIVQQHDLLFVRVNGMTVYSRQIERIGGNSIGVQQCTKSDWALSKLRIHQSSQR